MPPSNLATLPTLVCLLNQQHVPWAWGPHTLVGLAATLGLLGSGMEGCQSLAPMPRSCQLEGVSPLKPTAFPPPQPWGSNREALKAALQTPTGHLRFPGPRETAPSEGDFYRGGLDLVLSNNLRLQGGPPLPLPLPAGRGGILLGARSGEENPAVSQSVQRSPPPVQSERTPGFAGRAGPGKVRSSAADGPLSLPPHPRVMLGLALGKRCPPLPAVGREDQRPPISCPLQPH